MLAILILLAAITVSLIVTRIGTIALTLTGLSRESARFQARSAFTGVGFTTTESESVVNHPIRRRILMLMMLIGNAGLITVISSLILSFLGGRDQSPLSLRALLLVVGLAVLLFAARSDRLDRHLSRVIRWSLSRWGRFPIGEQAGLLHVGGDYQVVEMRVEEDDWIADKALEEADLPDEGLLVLGVQRRDGPFIGNPHPDTTVHDGDTLILFGESESLNLLDERKRGAGGDRDREEAVSKEKAHKARQKQQLQERDGDKETE